MCLEINSLFFRNRKSKLRSERDLKFSDLSHIYWFVQAFLVSLGISFHNGVEVTFVGATLEINQFYLKSDSHLPKEIVLFDSLKVL